MWMCSGLKERDLASTASDTCPSSIRIPPICALKATPTAHSELLGVAATWPAQRVPCLVEELEEEEEEEE